VCLKVSTLAFHGSPTRPGGRAWGPRIRDELCLIDFARCKERRAAGTCLRWTWRHRRRGFLRLLIRLLTWSMAPVICWVSSERERDKD